MQTEPRRPWARPKEGRWIAGVSGLFAARFGGRTGAWRAAFLAAGLLGLALCVTFALFDSAVLGRDGSQAVRLTGLVAGLVLLLAYPLLALVTPDARRPRVWDFASSFAVVLVAVLVGQAVGTLLQPYWRSAKGAWQARGASGWFTWFGDYAETHGFGLKDVVLVAFFLSAIGFVWMQRSAVRRFFRSMHTGVTLVSLATLAVLAGVLVPQIDGFEDPDQRVDLAREHEDYLVFRDAGYQKLPFRSQDGHEQYEAFRWAEGYFLYHLMHLYGIGMPEAELPPQAVAGLDSFGRKYGTEERDNREKQMVAAFGGRAKVDEIGAFIHENEDFFWRFFELSTVLQLNRTYKSHWFASLLFLLAIAVAFNTFKGRPKQWFTARKLGFFVVHVGVLTLLLGGFTSKLFTDRGILELRLGEPPKDVYYRHFDPRKKARMPFHVRLDHFARKDWPALEVHFLDEQFTSRVPRYTLWPDREIELDYVGEGREKRPRLRLRVLALHDRAEVGLPFASEAQAPGEGRGPLVEVRVEEPESLAGHLHDDGSVGREDDGHEHARRAYLFPLERYRQPLVDPGGAWRVAAVYDRDAAEAFPEEEGNPVVGFMEASVVGANVRAPQDLPVRIGEEHELPGGYRIRFRDATADFGVGRDDAKGSKHPLPLAEQPDGFAAVWVDIVGPDGPVEQRVVLEDIDDVEHGRQREHLHPDVVLKLRWDDWLAPGPPRYVLRYGPESTPTLFSEAGEELPVGAGEPLPLPGATAVIPLQFLHDAKLEKNLRFLPPREHPDGWDPDFYSPMPRGLELEVTRDPGTPDEVVERVEMASTERMSSQLWFSADERLALVFMENSEMLPFEWRSVLSILERDNAGNLYEVPLGPENEREIRVNDYFEYGGYRFFQTNARPEDPKYSGIGVVYDPGIPIVLLGMYTIIAGAAIAFLIRPMVLGWDKVAKT